MNAVVGYYVLNKILNDNPKVHYNKPQMELVDKIVILHKKTHGLSESTRNCLLKDILIKELTTKA